MHWIDFSGGMGKCLPSPCKNHGGLRSGVIQWKLHPFFYHRGGSILWWRPLPGGNLYRRGNVSLLSLFKNNATTIRVIYLLPLFVNFNRFDTLFVGCTGMEIIYSEGVWPARAREAWSTVQWAWLVKFTVNYSPLYLLMWWVVEGVHISDLCLNKFEP